MSAAAPSTLINTKTVPKKMLKPEPEYIPGPLTLNVLEKIRFVSENDVAGKHGSVLSTLPLAQKLTVPEQANMSNAAYLLPATPACAESVTLPSITSNSATTNILRHICFTFQMVV